MLKAGRVDFIIDEQVVVYDAIKNVYPKDVAHFKSLSKIYGDKTADAIMVSRKYPNSQQLLKSLNKGLATIKKNGTYDKIINKYKIAK